MTYIMGIDVGTTGTKAAVFDLNGALISQRYRSYELLTPKPGWRELDPNEVLEAVYDCVRGCCADGVGQSVKSVSVSAREKPWYLLTGKAGCWLTAWSVLIPGIWTRSDG